MKKLSYTILGFIIGAVLTYYFCPRNLEEDDITYEKPSGVIPIAEADSLNTNWNKYRCKAVDSCVRVQTGGKKDKDNRWASWSLDDIEGYLAYSKKQADSLGYNMTGIRVYLGVYGKNKGQSKKNLTTMFIVPTGKKSHAEASTNPFSLRGNDQDIPTPPLNRGTGGSGGYPQ